METVVKNHKVPAAATLGNSEKRPMSHLVVGARSWRQREGTGEFVWPESGGLLGEEAAEQTTC